MRRVRCRFLGAVGGWGRPRHTQARIRERRLWLNDLRDTLRDHGARPGNHRWRCRLQAAHRLRGTAADRESGGKDTVRNAEASGEFVVNVVDDEHAEAMNVSSGEYAPDVDEFSIARLASAPGVRVKAPRVATAPISLECRVSQIVRVGRGPHSVVFGEIVYMHVRDALYDAATGRIDVAALRPVGRLAGHMYSRTRELFELRRPNPDYKG